MMTKARSHGIQHISYKSGFALYTFDLTSDMAECRHVDPIKHGRIRMDIHLATPLAETVNVFVYSEYDVIQTDRARNVIMDF